MKKKIQISEGNLISLIKRIVLEQTVNPIRTNLNYTPAPLQTVTIPQAPVDPQVATGTMDMDTAETLAQQDAYRKQQLAQQKVQKPVSCPGGYKPPADGNYGLCTQGEDVKKLQTYLGFEGKQIDGYFGLRTLQALKKYNGKDKITKAEIDKLSNKQSVESNTENPQTKQPVQNNAGIVVNLRNVEPNTSFEKAFTKKTDGRDVINITNFRGNTFYSTNCKLLQNNTFWHISLGKYENFSKFPNLVKKLKYNFCSKQITNINVSKLIKGGTSQIPINDQRSLFGKTFRATINPDKSIHIVSDRPEVVLYTDCNNLKNNIFYKNYGQQINKGKSIELSALGNAIKPSFCATK